MDCCSVGEVAVKERHGAPSDEVFRLIINLYCIPFQQRHGNHVMDLSEKKDKYWCSNLSVSEKLRFFYIEMQ